MIPRLRIFVSSPGDVLAAREAAAQTIEKLAQDYGRHVQVIEPYLWEHEAMLASGHFQDSIEPPSAFDIVVLILWSRLGSPLPAQTAVRAYRGIDGRAPVTGTEWEYEEALATARSRGAPDLLVYRCRRPAWVDTSDAARREAQFRQLEALDRFWARHFANEGEFLGAYSQFDSEADFATLLEGQLRKLIDRRLAASGGGDPAGPGRWTKAPFRGLEDYEFEHAPIFFGQDAAVGRAMLQLGSQAQAGSPFLIVLGASGSGKSSLVKAGIVPKLFVPRRISGAAFVRRVLFRPSDVADGEDVFDAFARRLTAGAGPSVGLPELVSIDVTVADLAAHLRGAGEDPTLPLRIALSGLAAKARERGQMLAYESARLLIVLDQMEEIFTHERIDPDARRRFIDLVARLARSGLVWVVATMRIDFWHRAQETAELMRLAVGDGRLELLPPTPAQMSQVIRRPAEAAGVSFETHPATGIPLSEVIAEEVAREPGALPLLSFLLDQLYRADILESGGKVLTFATYDRLGRLEGAIATRADAVMEACAPEDRPALGSVLFSLVQMSAGEGEIERAVSRRVPLSAFAPGSAQRRVVEALLDPAARLLVSDATQAGEPTVRVAHEALISRWATARDFVRANAEALKIRRRLEDRHALWRAREAAGELAPRRRFARQEGLLTDIDLADGHRLLRDHRAEVEPDLTAFIERSIEADARARSRASRGLAAAASVIALLAIAATGAALLARASSDQAHGAQGRLLAEAAAARLKDGDVREAEGISLDLLTNRGFGAEPLPTAINTFQEARAADHEIAILLGHKEQVFSGGWSPDGRRVVTWSVDNNGRIWDAATGIQVATFTLPGGAYLTPIYSPDGQRILTVNGSETYVRVWDASTGESRGVIAVQNSKIVALAFSADGQRIVTLSADGRARIFDAAGRAQLAEIRVQPNVTDFNSDVAFSPDGRRLLVSGLGLVLVIDSATGATGLQIRAFDKESYPVVEFSPDGRFIIAANQPDGKARIWDVSTGGQVRELSSSAKILHAAFSPDGRRISTADHGGHIGVWDAATGAQLASMEAQGVVSGAIFSPDGRRLLTLSADHTARIWDSADGDERLRIAGGYAASLSPDGRRILTTAWIDGGGARVWDAASGALRVTLAGVNYPQLPAVFLPGGRRIYAVDEKGASAGVWDALTGRLLGAAPVAASGNTFRAFAAVSPNGRLALRQVSDFFEIRDLQTGGLVRTLPSSTSDLPLAAAAFSPDSTRLAIGLGSIGRVWETTGRRLPIALLGHEDWILDTVFSPDGRRITTASRDHTARIWDATNGRPLLVLRGHTGPIDSVRYSADGRRLLTAGRDGAARIWDASSGALLRVLSANSGSAPMGDFSPDAGRVATTAGDNSLRLWDAYSGAELADLRGHTDQIQTVAFSPDGRDVLTSSEDGSARLWDIANIPDLPDQLLWARAAQFEPLSDVDRARLGLRRSPSPQDQVRALFDRMRDPAALARQAEAAQRGAISETNEAQKNARLLTAFEGYAAATAAAEARGVPEETRRPWRYRRASLARILARAGKMREVAEAYGHIVGR